MMQEQKMAGLPALSPQELEAKIQNSDVPVLVEFGAPWCAPCKQIDPILLNLAATFAGKIEIVTIDVDQSPELAMKFGVMGVPTLILFQNGDPVKRLTGFRPQKVIEKEFFRNL
jgi:thioredoxin 1